MKFNRTPIQKQNKQILLKQQDFKGQHGLFKATLQDATTYGGTAVQQALTHLPKLSTNKNIIVDTKIHMLKKGMIPAIPGWHTDGVPRSNKNEARGNLPPDLSKQEGIDGNRYHLFLAGCDCPTIFLKDRNVELEVPKSGDKDLYAKIDAQILDRKDLDREEIPMGCWWSWDWWELHTAQPAREDGWRLLIRVTETSFSKPITDLRQVISVQSQVYINGSFGW